MDERYTVPYTIAFNNQRDASKIPHVVFNLRNGTKVYGLSCQGAERLAKEVAREQQTELESMEIPNGKIEIKNERTALCDFLESIKD